MKLRHLQTLYYITGTSFHANPAASLLVVFSLGSCLSPLPLYRVLPLSVSLDLSLRCLFRFIFSLLSMSSFFVRECSVRTICRDRVDFGRFAGPDPRVSFRGHTARRGQPFVAVRVCVFPLPSVLSSLQLVPFQVCSPPFPWVPSVLR